MTIRYMNADTGVDTGAGGIGAPWLTLGYAEANSDPEDTITCQDSTLVYSFAAVTFTKNLTILGEQDDASGAIFDGASGSNLTWDIDRFDVTIKKITIKNIIESGANSFVIKDPDNLTLENVVFNNIICTGTRSGVFGFVTATADTLTWSMVNCAFQKIQISTDSRANLFHIYLTSSLSINIQGCTAYLVNCTPNTEAIIKVESGDLLSLTVRNSIFSSDADVTWKSGNITSTDYSYSDFYNILSPPTGTGVLTSDPLFVDAANENFNLRPTSPCIDTGTLI